NLLDLDLNVDRQLRAAQLARLLGPNNGITLGRGLLPRFGSSVVTSLMTLARPASRLAPPTTSAGIFVPEHPRSQADQQPRPGAAERPEHAANAKDDGEDNQNRHEQQPHGLRLPDRSLAA